MTPRQWSVLALAGMGVIFMLISASGLVRMRGVHRRMQAASVGASLGITFLLLSAGLYYAASAQFGRMVLLVLFFFVTAPIATTAMARAAYRMQTRRVRRYLVQDDMSDPRYTPDYAAHSGPALSGPTARATPGPALHRSQERLTDE